MGIDIFCGLQFIFAGKPTVAQKIGSFRRERDRRLFPLANSTLPAIVLGLGIFRRHGRGISAEKNDSRNKDLENTTP